jgi:hypothetical protein
MSKVYVGDIGTEIILDCGSDISAATVRKIKAKKPNGSTVEWTASASGTNGIKYATLTGDLSMAGVWYLQAYVETAAWKGLGETFELVVSPEFA